MVDLEAFARFDADAVRAFLPAGAVEQLFGLLGSLNCIDTLSGGDLEHCVEYDAELEIMQLPHIFRTTVCKGNDHHVNR